MLSADELAGIRATQAANLPDVASVRRAARVSDGAGGVTQTWATIAQRVPCRLSMLRDPLPMTNAAQETVMADWIATTQHDCDLRADDELIARGHTLIVIGAVAGPWTTAGRWACRERR